MNKYPWNDVPRESREWVLALGDVSSETGVSLPDVFTRFVDLSHMVLCYPELASLARSSSTSMLFEEKLKVAGHQAAGQAGYLRIDNEAGWSAIVEALGQFLALVTKRPWPRDIFGPVYMEIGCANAARGQFFTPDSLSDVMARIVLANETIHRTVWRHLRVAYRAAQEAGELIFPVPSLEVEDDDVLLDESERQRILPLIANRFVLPRLAPYYEPVGIYDPCVGSGSTLLAAADRLPAWYVYHGMVLLRGDDLDHTCVKMFHTQALAFGLTARAYHANAMTMEIQTPVAYVAPYGVAGCAVELPGWVENVSQAERLFTREVVSHESSPSVTVVEPVTEKKAA